MTIYLSEKAAQAAGLVKAPRRKLGRATRPDIPAAGRAERTGLSTLILAGWSLEFIPARGYRLYRIGGTSTGWCVSEASAVIEAKAGH